MARFQNVLSSIIPNSCQLEASQLESIDKRMDGQVRWLHATDDPSRENHGGRIAWTGCTNKDVEQKVQKTHNMILVFKTPNQAEIHHVA